MEKQRYKIRNWKEYNEALVNRGRLTLWFDKEMITAWHDVENIHRGHPFTYSDVAMCFEFENHVSITFTGNTRITELIS